MTRVGCLALAITCGSLFGVSEARAAAGDFTYSTGSGTPQTWAGFGDSIMAGYCGLFCSVKSYASYYADSAAAENGWAVNLDANPQSGETTIQIYDEMLNGHLGSLQAADLVIWSAGGNDFLAARDAYGSSCDVGPLDQAMLDFQSDWDLIISLVSTEAKPEAKVRTMNIYYPNPDQDRNNFCGSVSDFEVFFPRLLDAGDYMCSTAAAAGFLCADSISAMNCDEIDANHTIDPNCLDPSGSNFRDPLNVVKYVGGVPTSWPSANNSGMIQSDRTHPGAVGQQYIADAHHALGYADGSGSVCGDATCDADETPATCPADCPDVCGDSLCTGAETTGTCPADCGTSCGDGTCNGSESTATCPADCGTSCGDGVCNGNEDTTNCTADCGTLCGDGTCNGAENTTDCPEDCGTFCGDGVCNGGETEANCADDCASTCVPSGQGAPCTASTDCCSGVGNCTGGKPANRVCAQASSGSVCGDGIVEGDEQCEAGVPLGNTCVGLGFESGTLACDEANCQYDTSACVPGSCAGNKEACSVNSDCCSNNCKGGACKGG
jgi:lysophospholipase L1-like esterase